jgi:ferredoxin/flavodoxin---NADP+ reductase
MSSELNATVTMSYAINHGLLVLQVTPDEPLPPFKAGQYTVLGLPGSAPRSPFAEPDDQPSEPEKIIKRAYSIASSSLHGHYFEFFVALVRTGR